ncbi:MAG: rhomboid family intramembrane serine protease [Chloroflexi bacterium]|nr:rhomboid family intramembrane serine protease [Chloroflexota bacterium]
MDPHAAGDLPADLEAALATPGPLPRSTALALVERGRTQLDDGEFEGAARSFSRVTGFDDVAITASALLGLGEAFYRLDLEDDAVASWEEVLLLPESPSTYAAWRNVAAARVRGGNLAGAITAYREADRRAPLEHKAEIAARLGWLAKETGNAGAARRYFARSRGHGPAVPLAYVILGLTVVVSFLALSNDGLEVFRGLELDKAKLAGGELYRLVTASLVHVNIVHLALNMYALYLLGPLVEGIWGTPTFGLFYVLTAVAASTASFFFSPMESVGASGAIFGLVGVLLAGTRVHHPVLDARARAIVPQLGTIVLVNLAFGFLFADQIDNAAHIGGLAAGLWLGFFVPPGRVPGLWALRSAALPAGGRPWAGMGLAALGILVLVAAILAVLVVRKVPPFS